MRYLVKRRGRTIDYVPIPKKVVLHRTNRGYQGCIGNRKVGIVHRGYRLVRARTARGAVKRVM